MLGRLLVFSALLAAPSLAMAGQCDVILKLADTQSGDALVGTYAAMLECNKEEAETAFEHFMKKGKDVDTITKLAVTAIDHQSYTPVWGMLDKIPDYEARDVIAANVGKACSTNKEIVPFLRGGYIGLRSFQFAQWDDAIAACQSDEVAKWLVDAITKPPTAAYDEKYNTLVQTIVRRQRSGAIGTLEAGAKKAATMETAPLNTLLDGMAAAVEPPGIGDPVKPEDQAALEAALVRVAKGATVPNAKMVADRLYNSGAEKAAASLLPTIYADRLQGGKLMYGVAAIESCDKQAIIHWASVMETGKRWSIGGADIESPMRASKAKLKCTSSEPWPVVFTPEPANGGKDVEDFVNQLTAEWTKKGMTVKAQPEKGFELN